MANLNKSLILNAASLLSESGENEEYDRAIVELVSDTLGISEEGRDALASILRELH